MKFFIINGKIFMLICGKRWTISYNDKLGTWKSVRTFQSLTRKHFKWIFFFCQIVQIWQRYSYFIKLSIRRCVGNDFQKRMNIIEKLETIGLNLCETFNLISYRDKEIVEWNRSGILLVTSIFITMIMMTIAIFNGFPAPMGCVPKTCFSVSKQYIPIFHSVNQNEFVIWFYNYTFFK